MKYLLFLKNIFEKPHEKSHEKIIKSKVPLVPARRPLARLWFLVHNLCDFSCDTSKNIASHIILVHNAHCEHLRSPISKEDFFY